jgi:hypothetical protein
VKEWYWCLCQEGFSLIALFFQGQEVMVSFVSNGGRSAIVLSKQIEAVVHRYSRGVNFFFPSDPCEGF